MGVKRYTEDGQERFYIESDILGEEIDVEDCWIIDDDKYVSSLEAREQFFKDYCILRDNDILEIYIGTSKYIEKMEDWSDCWFDYLEKVYSRASKELL